VKRYLELMQLSCCQKTAKGVLLPEMSISSLFRILMKQIRFLNSQLWHSWNMFSSYLGYLFKPEASFSEGPF